MYNAMLDDLQDEQTPAAEEAVTVAVKAVTLEDDDLVEVAAGEKTEEDVEELAAEDLLETGESESWSDDPVRMYLTQMGEIPLLKREEEIYLAKNIELTRAKFRRKLLECDGTWRTTPDRIHSSPQSVTVAAPCRRRAHPPIAPVTRLGAAGRFHSDILFPSTHL